MNQQTSIQIVVNDKPVEVVEGATILDLLDQLEIHHKAIAVELNYEIQPKDQLGRKRLQPDDRLEIVTLVGGG